MNYIVKTYQQESSVEDLGLVQIDKTVIDMGSVLRSRVNFEKGMTYGEIIKKYVGVVKHYKPCIPVFDGYSDDCASTKYITHMKRSKKQVPSNTFELASHLPFNCESKAAFFANKSNKQLFINMLSAELKNEGITALHATGDADQLIAKTAIDNAVNYTTQVIGEDTDIFILLVSLLKPNSKDLYMVTEKTTSKHPLIDIKAIREKLGEECAKVLPVIHAISGCDTTSKPFGIGKVSIMKKCNQIINELKPFLSEQATHTQIEEAGRKILCHIYGDKSTHYNLDSLRLKKFEQM